MWSNFRGGHGRYAPSAARPSKLTPSSVPPFSLSIGFILNLAAVTHLLLTLAAEVLADAVHNDCLSSLIYTSRLIVAGALC